jgi:hypothetical protein
MTIHDVIAKELARKGESLYWLSNQSGVAYPRVYDFIKRGNGINSANLEKLMATLNLELRRKK